LNPVGTKFRLAAKENRLLRTAIIRLARYGVSAIAKCNFAISE